MKNQMSAQTSVKLLGRSINSNQAGMSLIGVVFIIFVFGAMLVLGMKALPILNEYSSVKSGLVKAKSAGDEKEIRKAFDNFMSASYNSNFTSKELIFDNQKGQSIVGFSYERKILLAGPVSLLFEFAGSEYTR